MYLWDEMIRLHQENELSDYEITDFMGFVNTIITHITNGNEREERLVKIMGGVIIETKSKKWIKQGEAKMIIEMSQEFGLKDSAILAGLQEKIGVSLERAKAYLAEYGKQLV